MSEKLHGHLEKQVEPIDTNAESKRHTERLKDAVEHENAKTPENIQELAHRAKQEALSGKEINPGEKQEASRSTIGTQKELKETAYRRTLVRAQSQLSVPSRAFSKLVHKPAIEKASNVGAQTFARPSGILGGGTLSLIGSVIALFFAKRYGFEYNYLLFGILFAGGFLLGLVLELAVKLFRPSRPD